MTVKYFPLYFKNAVGLTPSQVQVVFALVPLFMVAMAVLAQKVSVTFGRVQCILVFRVLGITLLGTMVYLAEVLHVESWHSMVPLYLVNRWTKMQLPLLTRMLFLPLLMTLARRLMRPSEVSSLISRRSRLRGSFLDIGGLVS